MTDVMTLGDLIESLQNLEENSEEQIYVLDGSYVKGFSVRMKDDILERNNIGFAKEAFKGDPDAMTIKEVDHTLSTMALVSESDTSQKVRQKAKNVQKKLGDDLE